MGYTQQPQRVTRAVAILDGVGTTLKVGGGLTFALAGLLLEIVSVMAYGALWGVWGVALSLMVPPATLVYPFVRWAQTGALPTGGVLLVGGVFLGLVMLVASSVIEDRGGY